jgi:hypothetical protein
MVEWVFCGVCGVEVIDRVVGAGAPEQFSSLAFVNLNVVDNVNWEEFNVVKMDGKSRGGEYVVDA